MRFDFQAIGTRWQIDLPDGLPEQDARALERRIRARIDRFDKDYSRFRQDSLVAEMARTPGTYRLPDDGEPMFSLYEELYRRTHGAFTPLIGQVLVDAGYDAEYSLVPKGLRVPPSWDAALEYRYPKLTVKRPVLLDVGAAGKGYLIDIVAGVIADAGIADFCVDAGGDILHRGTRPFRVGLEDPGDAAKVLGVADIGNRSICGSAGNRRVWDRFHHIIDPRTMASPRNIIAVWTVADTTLLADALSTCLFFVPPQDLAGYPFEFLVLRDDYSVQKSGGFPAELFFATHAPPVSALQRSGT